MTEGRCANIGIPSLIRAFGLLPDRRESHKIIGYVGPTASRDQSVFNKIEQPTLIEIFKTKKQVGAPPVAWHVVNGQVKLSADGAKYEWDSTERPAISVGSRAEALKMCADFEKQLNASPART